MTPAAYEKLNGRSRYPHRVHVPVPGVSRVLAQASNNLKLGGWQQTPRFLAGRFRGFRSYTIYLEELYTCSPECPLQQECFAHELHAAVRWDATADTFFPALDVCMEEASLLDPGGFAIDVHSSGDFPTVAYTKRMIEYVYRYPAAHFWGNSAAPGEIRELIRRQNELTPIQWWVRTSGEAGLMTSVVIGRTITAEQVKAQAMMVCPAHEGNPDCNCHNCGFCPDSDQPLARRLHVRRSKQRR